MDLVPSIVLHLLSLCLKGNNSWGLLIAITPFPVPSGLAASTSPVFELQDTQTLTQSQEQIFKPL